MQSRCEKCLKQYLFHLSEAEYLQDLQSHSWPSPNNDCDTTWLESTASHYNNEDDNNNDNSIHCDNNYNVRWSSGKYMSHYWVKHFNLRLAVCHCFVFVSNFLFSCSSPINNETICLAKFCKKKFCRRTSSKKMFGTTICKTNN